MKKHFFKILLTTVRGTNFTRGTSEIIFVNSVELVSRWLTLPMNFWNSDEVDADVFCDSVCWLAGVQKGSEGRNLRFLLESCLIWQYGEFYRFRK